MRSWLLLGAFEVLKESMVLKRKLFFRRVVLEFTYIVKSATLCRIILLWITRMTVNITELCRTIQLKLVPTSRVEYWPVNKSGRVDFRRCRTWQLEHILCVILCDLIGAVLTVFVEQIVRL